MINKKILTLILISKISFLLSQEVTVKGLVFDKDGTSPMPFAYVVNKNEGMGALTDEAGKFSIKIKPWDTLSFSYVGYGVTKLFTHLLKDSVKNNILIVKVNLKPKTHELSPFVVSTHSISIERKESYERKINEYERGISSPLASPISAMYYAWSKKGNELQKLSAIYQNLIIEEIKEQRLSAEKIRVMTGDDTLNVKGFLSQCFLPNQFITSSSDYELFFAVKQCYKQYIEDRLRKK